MNVKQQATNARNMAFVAGLTSPFRPAETKNPYSDPQLAEKYAEGLKYAKDEGLHLIYGPFKKSGN